MSHKLFRHCILCNGWIWDVLRRQPAVRRAALAAAGCCTARPTRASRTVWRRVCGTMSAAPACAVRCAGATCCRGRPRTTQHPVPAGDQPWPVRTRTCRAAQKVPVMPGRLDGFPLHHTCLAQQSMMSRSIGSGMVTSSILWVESTAMCHGNQNVLLLNCLATIRRLAPLIGFGATSAAFPDWAPSCRRLLLRPRSGLMITLLPASRSAGTFVVTIQ